MNARNNCDCKTKNNFKNNYQDYLKISGEDDFWDKFVMYRLASVLGRLFIDMHITPNMITLMAMVSGVAGGVLFAFHHLVSTIVGVVLVLLSVLLDYTDGMVARTTGNTTELGHFLDGASDILVCISVYVSMTFHLMGDCIPFTDVKWGLWIWPVNLIAGCYFAAKQARDSDYVYNLHMYLSKKNPVKITRKKDIAKRLKDGNGTAFSRLCDWIFMGYTSMQEKALPKTQLLLDKIEAGGEGVSDALFRDFNAESRKYIRINGKIYSLRTYSLLLFSLLGIHFWATVFIVVVIEAIRIFIIAKYEKLSEGLLKKYFR